MSVAPPPRSPDQDELDALIEEARRRARRRRWAWAGALIAALAIGGGLYAGFSGGGGGGDRGVPSAREPSPGAEGKSARSNSASQQAIYDRRCPDRGLEILPLTQRAPRAAREIAQRTVGPTPPVTTTVRPALHAGARGSELVHMCGPTVARRSLVVFTWDHRFDHGRNRSASLAQHAFIVFRSENGYAILYFEH